MVLGTILVNTAGAAAERGAPEKELELPSKRRQQLKAQELLGHDRWRRFQRARFDMDLHGHEFTPDLADRPGVRDDLEEIVVSSFLRLGQKSVQSRLRLIERRDAVRARVTGRKVGEARGRERPGVDLSPRFNVGSRTALGAKMHLDGLQSRFWSGASLRLLRDVNGPDSSVKLAFRDDRRSVYVVYHTDHRKRGEVVQLGVSFGF